MMSTTMTGRRRQRRWRFGGAGGAGGDNVDDNAGHDHSFTTLLTTTAPLRRNTTNRIIMGWQRFCWWMMLGGVAWMTVVVVVVVVVQTRSLEANNNNMDDLLRWNWHDQYNHVKNDNDIDRDDENQPQWPYHHHHPAIIPVELAMDRRPNVISDRQQQQQQQPNDDENDARNNDPVELDLLQQRSDDSVFKSHHGSNNNIIIVNTTTTHPTTTMRWSNSYNVVHVVTTRFMQHQPNMTVLGIARLHLFRSFCLPTLQHQTTQQFLWLIRTDPALSDKIRLPLIEMLHGYDNFLLIGSNAYKEGFRSHHAVDDITPQGVWSGSFDLLRHYHDAAQCHAVLETRLDADDGIALDYLHTIQQEMSNTPLMMLINSNVSAKECDADAKINHSIPLSSSSSSSSSSLSSSSSSSSLWKVWCVDVHMEWQYQAPWMEDGNDDNNSSSAGNSDGLLPLPLPLPPPPRGSLMAIRAPYCVTPGLTWGYGIDMMTRSISISRNHMYIHRNIPRCQSLQQVSCLVRVTNPDHVPLAIRARTPTSAGMKSVITSSSSSNVITNNNNTTTQKTIFKRYDHFQRIQHFLWRHELPVLFQIQIETVLEARQYLQQSLQEMITETIHESNTCLFGQPCSKAMKAKLQQQQQQQQVILPRTKLTNQP